MRIGIDISQVIFQGTGAATYTKELLRTLLAIDPENSYKLFGASLRRNNEFDAFAKTLIRPVETAFVPIPPTLLDLLWNRFHKIPIEKFMGDIAVLHTSDATEPPSKAKKLTTVHDLVAFTYPETLHPTQITIQRERLAWVKKESTMIICVSEATKSDLQKYLEIADERITVIYEGVNFHHNASLRSHVDKIAKVRQKYKLPEQYLLNVGTLQPRKNLARLLQAYQRSGVSVPLVIAGNVGWGLQLPKINNVKLLGFVDGLDLPYVYAAAYAFLYPSLYEGFGLPVLEAMACGTPVITSNTSSLVELAHDQSILVDPTSVNSIAEGLNKVVGLSEHDYQSMQWLGINHAKQFTWEKTARETLAVYQKIVDN